MPTKKPTTSRKASAKASPTSQSAAAKPQKSVQTSPAQRTQKRSVAARTRFARFFKVLAPLRQRLGLCVSVVALIGAAQLGLWWKPTVGVYINAAAFAALCGIALWREAYRKLAISAAILPVTTMIVLSLPQTTNFAEAVVFYDALLLITLVYRFWFTIDEPLPNTALAARGYGLTLPLMMIVGQALGVAGYLLLRNDYLYEPTSLPLVAAASVVFAVAEEMFFRGLIQQRAAKLMHPALAAVMSAVLYTLASIVHGAPLVPLFALLVGAVLSFTYFKKQNLLLTITINAMSKLAYIGLLATFMLR